MGVAVADFPANAADLSTGGHKDTTVPLVAIWSGFYAGVNGGGGWSQDNNLAYGNSNGLNPSGGFGGGQIGYN